ncbi:MAG: hypothetical protein AB1305_05730, partial [Candidatus Hadarchaeota archaeon]
LADLLGALRDALAEIPVKKEACGPKVVSRVIIPNPFDLLLQSESPKLLSRIKELAASKGKITLADLVGQPSRESTVLTFFIVIFLCSEGKLKLEQPELFGPIFISLPERG